MDEAPHRQLLHEIEAFCSERAVSRTTFGLTAVNDPNFLSDLEAGREPRWSTMARVRAAMKTPELFTEQASGSPK